jgi:hypothetical protein
MDGITVELALCTACKIVRGNKKYDSPQLTQALRPFEKGQEC